MFSAPWGKQVSVTGREREWARPKHEQQQVFPEVAEFAKGHTGTQDLPRSRYFSPVYTPGKHSLSIVTSEWARACNWEDLDKFPSPRELWLGTLRDIGVATRSKKLHHLFHLSLGPAWDLMKPIGKCVISSSQKHSIFRNLNSPWLFSSFHKLFLLLGFGFFSSQIFFIITQKEKCCHCRFCEPRRQELQKVNWGQILNIYYLKMDLDVLHTFEYNLHEPPICLDPSVTIIASGNTAVV